MKGLIKITLLLSILLYSSHSSTAYTVFNTNTKSFENSDTVPSPKRIVETIPNGFKVTYYFDAILLEPDSIKEGAFYPIIEGFGQTWEEGKPWLPLHTDRFCFTDSICEVEVVDKEFVSTKIEISPARTCHSISEDFKYSKSNLPQINCSEIYPQNPICIGRTDIYRNSYIKNVTIYPVQYINSFNIALIYKKISFNISNKQKRTVEGSSFGQTQLFDPYFNGVIANRDSINNDDDDLNIPIAIPRSYLILAPEKLQAASTQLYWWKQWMGYSVYLETRKKWTPELIKAAVREFYDSDPNAYFLLLIGDNELMPSEQYRTTIPQATADTTYHAGPHTDLFYACMDGEGDEVPDLYYGRIPASTNEELQNIVDKISLYESNPNKNRNFTYFVAATQFVDGQEGSKVYKPNGIEDLTFARTTETIAQQLETIFDKTDRLYSMTTHYMPWKWSSGTYNFPFPESLKSLEAWSSTTSDVIKAFNLGPNIVVHHDHGGIDGWGQPRFTSSDVEALSNSIYPIIFSINCNTGNYVEKDNWAKAILGLKGRGASAIIASSDYSYTGYNDLFLLGMMKGLWPDKDFSYHAKSGYEEYNHGPNSNIYSLGEIMQYGMNKLCEHYAPNDPFARHTRRCFHCLGDPSLYVFWGADYGIEDGITKHYIDGNAIIKLEDGKEAMLSFWDSTGQRHGRQYGNYLFIEDPLYEEIAVYIYERGMKPIKFFLGNDFRGQNNSISEIDISDNHYATIKLSNPNNLDSSLTVVECKGLTTINVENMYVIDGTADYKLSNLSSNMLFISLYEKGVLVDSRKIFIK